MTSKLISLSLVWVGLWLALVAGCSSSAPESGSEPAAAEQGGQAEQAEPAEEKPFELGDLVEPFNPPPLAELDKAAGWYDRPVLDGMEVLRQQQANEPKVLPVQEALALRNDSDKENEEILNSLGREAPPDGQGVDYDAAFVRHVAGDLNSTNPLLISSITEFEYQTLTGFNGGGLLCTDRDLHYFAPRRQSYPGRPAKIT